MKKANNLWITLGMVLLVAFSMDVFATRGRVQISNNTLKTDRGTLLRGARVSLDIWDETPSQADINTLKNRGLNTLHVYAEYAGSGQNGGYNSAKVDHVINLADQNDLYVILTIGCGGDNGSFDGNFVESFWNFYAPRYKDRTHVVYELMNEPQAWSSPYNTATLNMERDGYWLIRYHAPNTHIMMMTYAVPINPTQVANECANLGIDWSNASVAFHGYGIDGNEENALTSLFSALRSKGIAYGACTEPSNPDGHINVATTRIFEQYQVSYTHFINVHSIATDDNRYYNIIVWNNIEWVPDFGSWPLPSCSSTSITPYVQVNDGNWQQTSSVTVDAGAKIVFGPQPTSGGSWSWSGGGTSGSSREQTIYPNNSITATATYTNGCGAQSTQNFNVIVNGSGGAIALQGNNGNYVSSENGESAMNCNRTSIGSWEKFEVVDAGDGKIALRGNNGMYVSSENGQNPMNCNRTSIGSWEKFTRIDAGEGKYALQGNNGMYVSSENGTSAMNCNRTSIGEWEKFNWVPTTKSAVLNDDASLTRTLELDVYPNPSTDGYFTVSITNNDDENFKLSVYSTDGRKVFGVDAYSGNTQLDLSNLKSGMYILNIEGAGKVWTKKLLKN